MEIPSTYTSATFEQVLDDLSVRFIINLPQEELASRERVCFQIEEAHWYYEDFIREQNPHFPALSLVDFLGKIFAHCPLLSKWGMHKDAYKQFMEYKQRVPIRGAILLNEKMDKMILVKGWKSGSSWSFPRGKINKDEPDHVCAVREVLEETGYSATDLIDPSQYLLNEALGHNHMMLYIIPNVPEDFNFYPLARKEISEVAWFTFAQIQAYKKRPDEIDNKTLNLRTYMVLPFIRDLRNWIKRKHQLNKHQRKLSQKQHAGIYNETEPESSAVEITPPRETVPKATKATPRDKITLPAYETLQPALQPPASTNLPENDENQLSLASAKLRNLIGIGKPYDSAHSTGYDEGNPQSGALLLAHLQKSAAKAPTELVSGQGLNKMSGQSNILASPLSSHSPQNFPPGRNLPLNVNHGSKHSRAHKAAIVNGSPHSPDNYKKVEHGSPYDRNGQRALQTHLSQSSNSKPPITILQRGQLLPRLDEQYADAQLQPQHSSTHTPLSAPNPQSVAASPAKQARRPILTLESFIPPAPMRAPDSAHTGSLLDILKGAAPPPPAEPSMQLQSAKPDGASDLLALLKKSATPVETLTSTNLPTDTQDHFSADATIRAKAKAPTAEAEHMASLFQSLGKAVPKKISPPPSTRPMSQITKPFQATKENQSPLPGLIPNAENLKQSSTLSQDTQLRPRDDTISKNSPLIARPEARHNSPSFDRRATVKSEQAQVLLNMFKQTPTDTSSNIVKPVEQSQVLLNLLKQGPVSQVQTPSKAPEQAQVLLNMFKQNPNIAPATSAQVPEPVLSNLTLSNSMSTTNPSPATLTKATSPIDKLAPEMKRSGSLTVEQNAFLFNFLDNLATKYGV